MKKIWLTYAWKDNEEEDVDFVVQQLKAEGLAVGFDRVQLQAGKRLWEQIDRLISDPDLNAWAIYVTENSLQSEACLEELAYALDRSLRERGSDFPIIGIFPKPIDRSMIPSAIATRLYVTLEDNEWAQRVAASVSNTPLNTSEKNVVPYRFAVHTKQNNKVFEVWPRAGTWLDFMVAVEDQEGDLLKSVMNGARGAIIGTGIVTTFDVEIPGYKALGMRDAVTPQRSAQVFFSKLPSKIIFGATVNGERVEYTVLSREEDT